MLGQGPPAFCHLLHFKLAAFGPREFFKLLGHVEAVAVTNKKHAQLSCLFGPLHQCLMRMFLHRRRPVGQVFLIGGGKPIRLGQHLISVLLFKPDRCRRPIDHGNGLRLHGLAAIGGSQRNVPSVRQGQTT